MRRIGKSRIQHHFAHALNNSWLTSAVTAAVRSPVKTFSEDLLDFEQDYLQHMHDAVARIQRYTHSKSQEEFAADEQLQDAVVRNIEVIGEAARNVTSHSPEFCRTHDYIPWAALYAMRNQLSHGYWTVDLDAQVAA